MKTKFIFCCFLLPLAAMVFWGCPTGKVIYPQIYFSDEFKAYTQFKPGSYWIYVDSLSDEVDSVYLYKSTPTTLKHSPAHGNCDRERNFMYFKSHFYKDTLLSICNAECEGLEDYQLGGTTIFFNYNKQYIQEVPLIQIGDSTAYITKTYYEAFFDSLNIKTNNYYNIRVYQLRDKIQRTPYVSYWVKDIGIVKKYNDNRVWELLRYHIVK